MVRINGIAGVGNIDTNTFSLVSEINTYPIGLAFFLKNGGNVKPIGININKFSQFGYDDYIEVYFHNVPYVEINNLLPTDYRTKYEIINAVAEIKE